MPCHEHGVEGMDMSSPNVLPSYDNSQALGTLMHPGLQQYSWHHGWPDQGHLAAPRSQPGHTTTRSITTDVTQVKRSQLNTGKAGEHGEAYETKLACIKSLSSA